MGTIDQSISKLIAYGLEKGLFDQRDEVYVTNRVLEILGLDEFEKCEVACPVCLEETLRELLDFAVERGLLEDNIVARDLFDTKLMGALLPRPSEVTKTFYKYYAQSPEAATDYFYAFSRNSDYIRQYRVAKDKKWVVSTEYGELDVTINLSKPEKDNI